jgi:hypothetical protein
MISRVKPSTWAVNEKLTSAQINQIDTSLTYALDKRDGYSDTLGSDVTVTGGSLTFSSGTSITTNSGSTALFGGSVAVSSSGTLTVSAGSTTNLASTNTITGNTTFSTGTLTVNSATSLVGAVTAGNFTLTSINKIKLASRNATRVWQGNFIPNPNSSWRIYQGYWKTSSTATAQEIIGDIDLPHNATMGQIILYVKGGSGHGALPSVMPFFKLYRINIATGAVITVNTITDNSSDVTDYELFHNLIWAGALSIDRNNYKYQLVFTSEDGTGVQDDFELFGMTVTYAVSEMDDFR